VYHIQSLTPAVHRLEGMLSHATCSLDCQRMIHMIQVDQDMQYEAWQTLRKRNTPGRETASCLFVNTNDAWNANDAWSANDVLAEIVNENGGIAGHRHEHMGHPTLQYDNEIGTDSPHHGFDKIYKTQYERQLLSQPSGHTHQLDEMNIVIIESLLQLRGQSKPLSVFQHHR